jgi:GAF domain-containing protein
MINSQSGS